MNKWYQKKLSKSNKVLLEGIKLKVELLLNYPAHRHFTDHTLEHSERIIKILGMLLKGQNNLGKDELFILLAAAYMHDLGMQIKKSDLLKYPDLQQLLRDSGLKKRSLTKESTLLTFIREWHHLFSYHMINDLFRDELGLEKCRYTEEIALVAQGHRKVNLSSEQYKRRGYIRVDLLSALLRLADELDCENSRIDLERMMVIDMSVDNKMYWYNHWCIDRLEIKNKYIKLFGRVPIGYVDKFKFLFVMPIWKKYREVLDIFFREGIFIAWASSEIIESEHITRIFQREEGLLEYIEEKCSNINQAFDIPAHLGDLDKTATLENILSIDISPFYSTGIKQFNGIKITKWPEKTRYCQFLIYDSPEKLRGDLIPEEEPIWESKRIKAGQSISEWPELDKTGEYGYLIIFYEKEDEYIYMNRRGKFRFIDDSKFVNKKIFTDEINDSILSLDEKKFVQGCIEARIGNYGEALLMLQSLLTADISWRSDVLIQIISIYKTIKRDMDEMEWYDEGDKISNRLDYLLFQFWQGNT